MGEIKRRLIETALGEWDFFGRSTRGLDDDWNLAGDQADEPFRSRVGLYWAAVGRPELDGGSDEPWSAAFISWCFAAAGAGAAFSGHDTHSVYVDRIRRHDGMSPALVLAPPAAAPLAPGDLIWNSRWESESGEAAAPKSFEAAVAAARGRQFLPLPRRHRRRGRPRAAATASAATSPTATPAARSPARPGASPPTAPSPTRARPGSGWSGTGFETLSPSPLMGEGRVGVRLHRLGGGEVHPSPTLPIKGRGC